MLDVQLIHMSHPVQKFHPLTSTTDFPAHHLPTSAHTRPLRSRPYSHAWSCMLFESAVHQLGAALCTATSGTQAGRQHRCIHACDKDTCVCVCLQTSISASLHVHGLEAKVLTRIRQEALTTARTEQAPDISLLQLPLAGGCLPAVCQPMRQFAQA